MRDQVKILGVTLDSLMAHDMHIANTCRSCYKHVYEMLYITLYTPSNILIHFNRCNNVMWLVL